MLPTRILGVVLVTLFVLTSHAAAGGKVDWSEYIDKQRAPLRVAASDRADAGPAKSVAKARGEKRTAKAKAKKTKAKARAKKKTTKARRK